MTITIFGHRITIFAVERLEKYEVKVSKESKQQAADLIKSESFQSLKAQAKAAREARHGR